MSASPDDFVRQWAVARSGHSRQSGVARMVNDGDLEKKEEIEDYRHDVAVAEVTDRQWLKSPIIEYFPLFPRLVALVVRVVKHEPASPTMIRCTGRSGEGQAMHSLALRAGNVPAGRRYSRERDTRP